MRRTFAANGRAAYGGYGSSIAGGRWNSPGVFVAYAATSPSLARLEVLAHIDRSRVAGDYAYYAATVPDDAVASADDSTLPHGWAAEPSGLEPASLGDRFVREAFTLALSVPSVLVPVERNVLLNPSHERFAEVAFEHPMAWPLDA